VKKTTEMEKKKERKKHHGTRIVWTSKTTNKADVMQSF
jgi:hypothetical protein